MRSIHNTVGTGPYGLVTCRIYEDGDVVVCHGSRGNCENMREVSGFGPMMNMCDRLDVPSGVEDRILDFVHQHNEFIDRGDE